MHLQVSAELTIKLRECVEGTKVVSMLTLTQYLQLMVTQITLEVELQFEA